MPGTAIVPPMLLAWLLLTLTAFTSAGTGDGGAAQPARAAIAAEGDHLGDAEVIEVKLHPEFQRVTVRLPDGRALPLEVTVTRAGTHPACDAEGLGVYPRWELLAAEGADVEIDPAGAASTRALCARLEQQAADLDIGLLDKPEPAEAPPEPPPDEGPRRSKVHLPTEAGFSWRPLHGLLLATLLAAGAALAGPVRRGLRGGPWPDLLAVLATSLLARLLLSQRGLIIAPDAGYERIEMAWDMVGAHPLYGGGFGVLHSPLQRLTGFDPAAIFDLHLGLSALAPPLLWAVAWSTTRERAGALLAGLSLALLPVALRLAGSEVEQVPLASFELLAMAAALSWRRNGAPSLAALAATAAAFAIQLRPEALAFGVLPGLLLLEGSWRRRSRAGLVAALVLAGFGLLRLVQLPLGEGAGALAAPDASALGYLGALLRPTWGGPGDGRGSTQVFLDLRHTPALLPLLALWGLTQLRDRARRGTVLIALAWWGLCLLPVFPKAWPQVDAWRLQLAAQAPCLLLAGVGVAALPRLRGAAVALAVLSALPLLPFAREQWAGQAEWQALAGQIATLPPTATVYVPEHEVHGAKQRQVGALLARRAGTQRPDWRPLSPFAAAPEPGPDIYVWQNLTCRIASLPGRHVVNDRRVNPCLQLSERCTLTPFATTVVPTLSDVDISFREEPVEVGLYRLDGCGGGEE